MKRVLFFVFLLAAVSLTSCKKCITCQIQAGASILTVPEKKCGGKNARDDFEKEYKEKAQIYATAGARAVCTTE